jgi:hypothetical protein
MLLCILSAAGEVRADWEFTRWGMTPKEVRYASPVKVSAARQDDRVLKRISRESSILAFVEAYDWRGHTVEVRFGFDAYARLNGIFLLEGGSSFAYLDATLSELYGEPLSHTRTPLPCRLWVDRESGDVIRLRRIRAAILEQVPATRRATLRCLGPEHPAEAEDRLPAAPPPGLGVDSS